MKAARVHQFGPPSVIKIDDAPCPAPELGEVLVRVADAGVGPWDALIREGKSVVNPPLPLTLGSDISGAIEAIGPGVSGLDVGEEVYGVTNKQFCGAYAEYALATATMVALKPRNLSHVEAASAPVVAVTALQMLVDYAHATARQSALIHGAAGNVGAYAVQLSRHLGLDVTATCAARDFEYVRSLGANTALDYRSTNSFKSLPPMDVVIDTVGGDTRDRSIQFLKPGGILVSVVSPIPEALRRHSEVRTVFFLVEVTTARLNTIKELFESGKLVPQVGTVLPLQQARAAHEMLGGAPHQRGKIVLKIAP